jgi:hypothetical protein
MKVVKETLTFTDAATLTFEVPLVHEKDVRDYMTIQVYDNGAGATFTSTISGSCSADMTPSMTLSDSKSGNNYHELSRLLPYVLVTVALTDPGSPETDDTLVDVWVAY